jgi:hypothetical protein
MMMTKWNDDGSYCAVSGNERKKKQTENGRNGVKIGQKTIPAAVLVVETHR